MQKRKKIALILHGFPGLSANNPIEKYFQLRNFEIVKPNLFDTVFEFNESNIIKEIEKSLLGRTPHVLLGVSMGGFFVPKIAKKYFNARLVLVASGPRVEIGIPIYNYLVKKSSKKVLSLLLIISKNLPTTLYELIYKFFNPNLNKGQIKRNYDENIISTINLVKSIPNSKILEIINLIKNKDNTKELSILNNQTLIIGGGRDIMMPLRLSNELNSLLKNSVLLKNENRLHYDVFDERDFEKLDDFLS